MLGMHMEHNKKPQAKKPRVEWQFWSAPLRQQIIVIGCCQSQKDIWPIIFHIRIPSPNFLLKFTPEMQYRLSGNSITCLLSHTTIA